MSSNRLTVRKSALASAIFAALSITATPPTVAQAQLMLEEVVVTAQKREASVQDISATVNVVTGDALDEYASFSFADVAEQTAGLTLYQPNARNNNVAMRGVGTDPEAGAAGAVDIFWNDMQVRSDIAFNALYDLERLEVLRGPQGTLQGSASPGGAINIITRGPDMADFAGSLQASVSDNEGTNMQFAYGGPIIKDVLAVRVAGVYDVNESQGVRNPTISQKDPESETNSYRITVEWQPGDNFNTRFVYQNLDKRVDDTKSIVGTDALGQRPTLRATDEVGLGQRGNFGDLDFDIYTLTANWEMANHDVTVVYGIQDSTKFSMTENDRADYISDPAALTHQTAETLTDSDNLEIRIASLGNESWDYMVGLYWLDQKTTTEFVAHTTLPSETIPFPFGGLSFSTTGAIPVNGETKAIFTHNRFHISDLLTAELGLRYSEYESFRRADVFWGAYNVGPDPQFYDLIDSLLNLARFPISGISTENESSEDDAVTGSFALRYEYSDATSIYASYNRGFRRGGISIIPDPDVQFLPDGEDTLIYDSEESNTIELGFKSRFWNGRAQLNGAFYYQQFDGYFGFTRGVQVLDAAGSPADISGGIVFNGDATIWGLELEGQALLSERLKVGGALSYNKGEWDGAEAPCNVREAGEALGFCDIDGEALGGEPEVTFSMNAEYHIPMENSEWYLRGLWKFTDDRLNTLASAGIGSVTEEYHSYNNINLYTGLRASDYSWDVSLWVKNLLDEDEITFHDGSDQYDLQLSGGSYDTTNILAPRTAGVTARYNF